MQRLALAIAAIAVAIVVWLVAGRDRTPRTAVVEPQPTPVASTVTPPGRAAMPSLSVPAGSARIDSSGSGSGGATASFSKRGLQAQLVAVDPLVAACVERAVAAGKPVDGTATLPFIIAPKDGAIVVEDVSIDHDDSTIDDAPLLECMRDTARELHFDAVPNGVNAVSITRRVVVKDGKVVEHRVTEYANLRDSDHPLP